MGANNDTILSSAERSIARIEARYFKEKMQAVGFDIGRSVTPITPVMLKAEELTQTFSRRLFEEGMFATAIAYPTVPLGQARIRVMISAAHSREDLDQGLTMFDRVGRELGVILKL